MWWSTASAASSSPYDAIASIEFRAAKQGVVAVSANGLFDHDIEVERVLVITAHPDDLDFGCAGTIATLTDMGIEVSYCICTNGDAGGFDPAVPREAISGIRQAEQMAAAAVLGVTDLHFLGYPDGQLVVSHELRRDISRVIRQVRPQLVITQTPERNWERIYGSHPDHMAAGDAALMAVYPDSRNPFAHPSLLADEGLTEWTVQQVWVMGGMKRTKFLDVTKHFDRKLRALRSHVSQTEHVLDLEDRIRDWMTGTAAEGGMPDGTLAESFLVIDSR
jgi:LmbE family N-acetylglucosaminyl deacetylase